MFARQINEVVRKTSSSATIIMNSKSEFHLAPIVGVLRAGAGAGIGGTSEGNGEGEGRRRAGPGVGPGAGGERQRSGRPGS